MKTITAFFHERDIIVSNYTDKSGFLLPVFIQFVLLLAAFALYISNTPGEGMSKHAIILISLAASMVISVPLGRKLIDVSFKSTDLAAREAMAESVMKLVEAMEDQHKEFKTHISDISDLLRRGQNDELDAYLNRILNNTARQNVVINVEQPIIEALLRSKAAEAAIRKIRLEVDVSVSLARQEENAFILARILGNLLDNAFDAVLSSHAGEKYVSVRITRTGPLLRIEVHNNGPAIPPEELDLIFTKGYTKKGKGHSGMGLFIVKTLTEKISGVVRVSSAENEGTSFIVTMPAR